LCRGYGGYNTRWALEAMPHIFRAGDELPMLVTVFFGANDAVDAREPMHVPLEEYQENLIEIAQRLQRLGVPRMIFITPGRVGEEQRLRFQKRRYGNKATGVLERTDNNAREYANACARAALELNLPVVNLWAEMHQNPAWKELLSDGVHFTPQGNQCIANSVVRVMERHYPELVVTPDLSLTAQLGEGLGGKSFTRGSVSELPIELPLMMEIDPANYKPHFQNLLSVHKIIGSPLD